MAVLNLTAFKTDFEKKPSVFVNGRDFNSLTFRFSGKISITDKNGNTVISNAPCITFVPKGMSYHTEVLESGEMIAVHFDESGEIFSEKLQVFDTENNPAFSNLFLSLLENQNKGKSEKFSSFSVFYEILSMLSRIEQKKIPKIMRRAKELFDKNFSDSSLSVSSVAHSLKISEVYLRREFKKYFGASPLNYINKKRISTAKAMLKTDYYTISKISELCGFLSLSYFSYSFRKATGFSPSDYSKRVL